MVVQLPLSYFSSTYFKKKTTADVFCEGPILLVSVELALQALARSDQSQVVLDS